jgi:hypothetical protein
MRKAKQQTSKRPAVVFLLVVIFVAEDEKNTPLRTVCGLLSDCTD